MAEKKQSAADKKAAGDKKSALETALAQIEKQFGKGAVMKLGQNVKMCIRDRYYATNSRVRGALYALLSGLAEPAGALLAFFLLRSFISPLFLNGLIATIAGIMIYVSISELIPEGFSYGRRGYTCLLYTS